MKKRNLSICHQCLFLAALLLLPFAPMAKANLICDWNPTWECPNILEPIEITYTVEYEYEECYKDGEEDVCTTYTETEEYTETVYVEVEDCGWVDEYECWDDGDDGSVVVIDGGGDGGGGAGGSGGGQGSNGHYEEIAIPHTDCQSQGYLTYAGEEYVYGTTQDCYTWYEYETVYVDDYSGTSTPGAASANDAAFVTQNVPATMTPGQTATVSVTMKNIGSMTWAGDPAWNGASNPKPYRLGVKNANNWGLPLEKGATGSNTARVDVNTKVALNQDHTFTFNITAPATPGTYDFQWQMVQEQVEWFGATTPSVSIVVAPPAPPPPPSNGATFVSQNVPKTMTPGQTAIVSVTMKNTGNTTWNSNLPYPYNLGSQKPQDNMTWGLRRVSVGDTPVQPGQEKTFTFIVTAPTVPNTYNLQWRMVQDEQDGQEWFGDFSTNASIVVSNGSDDSNGGGSSDGSGHWEQIAIPHTDCENHEYLVYTGEQCNSVSYQDSDTWYEYAVIRASDSGEHASGSEITPGKVTIDPVATKTITLGQSMVYSSTAIAAMTGYVYLTLHDFDWKAHGGNWVSAQLDSDGHGTIETGALTGAEARSLAVPPVQISDRMVTMTPTRPGTYTVRFSEQTPSGPVYSPQATLIVYALPAYLSGVKLNPISPATIRNGQVIEISGTIDTQGVNVDALDIYVGDRCIQRMQQPAQGSFSFTWTVSGLALKVYPVYAKIICAGTSRILPFSDIVSIPQNEIWAYGFEKNHDENGIKASGYYHDATNQYPARRTIGNNGTWTEGAVCMGVKSGNDQISMTLNGDSITYANRMSSGTTWCGNEAVLMIKDPAVRYMLKAAGAEAFGTGGTKTFRAGEMQTEYFDTQEARDDRAAYIRSIRPDLHIDYDEEVIEWRVVDSCFWPTGYGQNTMQSRTIPIQPSWAGKELTVRAWAFHHTTTNGSDFLNHPVEFYAAATRVVPITNSPPTVQISAKGRQAKEGQVQNITAAMGERVEFTLSAADVNGDLQAINFWVLAPGSTVWRNIRADGTLNSGYVENTTVDTTVSSGVGVASLGPVQRSFTLTLDEGFGTYQFHARSRDSHGISSETAIINVQVDNRAPGTVQSINGVAQGNSPDVPIGMPIPITVSASDADGNLRAVNLWVLTPTHGWRNIRADGSLNDAIVENSTTDNFISSGGVNVASLGPKTCSFTPTPDEGVGVYQITARGMDSEGQTSPPGVHVYINVVSGNQPSVPDDLSASNVGSKHFTFKWNPSTSNTSVTGYEVLLNGTVLGTTSNAMMEITGLTASTTYSVSVRAFDGAGNYSDLSAPITVTTNAPGVPSAPPTLPSDWANDHNLNPNDALGDANGNGLSNIAEYNLGANPTTDNTGSGGSGDAVLAIMEQAGATTDTAVGVTPGNFAVDKNGSATYSIPIAVTPGSAGVQPSISLEYNSSNGSGIAGFGWSLAGLSSIVRGGQAKEVDDQRHAMDFTYADRYYFDGQRLVAISGQDGHDGTEYRLESDNFTRVVSYGASGQGPAWFKAWTKSGLIVELGNTMDSAQKIGTYNEVLTWQVNKVSDTVGNYMTFEYVTDPVSHQQVISKINYTGNGGVAPYASVQFDYENRPDVMSGYIKGAPVSANQRLTAIRVCYGAKTVRKYTLTYVQRDYNNRSILASVTESGADGKAYKPITFEYSDPPYGWDAAPIWTPPTALVSTPTILTSKVPPRDMAFIDLDGDGRVDCVQKASDGTSNAWLNTESGWVIANGTDGEPDFRLPDSCALIDAKGMPNARFADFNGDGLVDVMDKDGNVYLNTGSGFVFNARFSLPEPTSQIGSVSNFTRGMPEVLDLDGDGRVDVSAKTTGVVKSTIIIGGLTHPTGSTEYTNFGSLADTWLNTGGGTEGVRGSAWKPAPQSNPKATPDYEVPYLSSDIGVCYIDINGDGLVDIVRCYSNNGSLSKETFINTGSSFVKNSAYDLPVPLGGEIQIGNTIFKTNYTGAEFVDLNGDGLPDLIIRSRGAANFSYDAAYLNTGSGWVQADNYKAPVDLAVALDVAMSQGPQSQGCAFIDINNDGLPDLVYALDSDKRGAWLNTGTGWIQAPADMNLPYALRQSHLKDDSDSGAVLNDFNGDGVVDLAWSGFAYSTYYSGGVTNKRVNPDRLTKVTSGLGVAVHIDYAPLTELYPGSGTPTVYDKGPSADPSKVDISIPMYVVKTVSNETGFACADGTSDTYDLVYRYGGMRVEQDHGLLGFEWMQVTDTRTGINTKTFFSQDYQTLGMVTELITTSPDGIVLNESTSGLGLRSYGPNNKVHFAYTSDTLQKTHELNGKLISTTYTTYAYDDYGNATVVVVDTSDEASGETYKKTSTNTYENCVDDAPSQTSLTGWMLGRLISSTVTTVAPNVQDQTRTSDFEYYTATGLLKMEIVEPDAPDASPLKLTTTYEYDAFGNKTKSTTTGFGLEAGRTVSTTYDPQGRFPTKTTNALGHTENYTYNQELGVIESTTGPNGITTKWEYDGFARPIREIRACGTDSQTETATSYLWSTNSAASGSVYLQKTESSGSPPAITFFDSMGRAIASWAVNPGDIDGQPRIVVTETAYDSYGRDYAKSMPHYLNEPDANIHWAKTYAYDILNRPLAIATPDEDMLYGEVISTMEYDGLVTRTINPLGQIEEATKNTQGQIIKRINNLNADTPAQRGEIHYTYDAYGNLLEAAVYRENGASPVVTTFEYDNRGRKISMTDPDMGTWTYAYNAGGELTSQTDAKGQTTTMTYDALGRMTKRTDEADGTVATWTYDTATNGKGKLASLLVKKSGEPDYSESFTYDALGRPVAQTRSIDGKSYTTKQEYDAYSRPSVMEYPDGFRVKNCYDTLGFLKEIRAAGGTIASYGDVLPEQLFWRADSYTAAGALNGATYGNGLTYDAVISQYSGRIKAIGASVCNAAGGYYAINHVYEYDALGQVTRRFDQVAGRDERFTYDGLNRLTSYNINNGPATTVAYDALGNITQKSDVGNYYYDPDRAHAVTSAGGQTYTYDANGNQVSSAGRTLEWSAADQVKKITSADGTLSTTFRFGAGRERIVQQHSNGTKTTYVGDTYEKVEHPDGLVEEKCYIFTPLGRTAVRTVRSDSKIEMRYFHQDGLGSIVAVSDEYGRVEQRFAFDPWGKRQSLLNLRDENGGEITRGFTDHEMLEDFGLIHMNGRIFDPILARFTAADPFVRDSGVAQSYNRYSYIENNPLNGTDPSGYRSFMDYFDMVFVIAMCVIVTVGTYGAGTAAWGATGWGAFWASVAAGAAGGFVGAFISADLAGSSPGAAFAAGLKGAAIGALTAAASYGIGVYFDKAKGVWSDSTLNWAGRTLSHATVGGITSELQGDDFRHGFISSAISTGIMHIKGVDNFMGKNTGGWAVVGRTSVAAAIGGTAAELSGGKFANGAITSAMQHLFNAETRKAALRALDKEISKIKTIGQAIEVFKKQAALGIAHAQEIVDILTNKNTTYEFVKFADKNKLGNVEAEWDTIMRNGTTTRTLTSALIQVKIGTSGEDLLCVLAHEVGHAVLNVKFPDANYAQHINEVKALVYEEQYRISALFPSGGEDFRDSKDAVDSDAIADHVHKKLYRNPYRKD